MLGYDCFECQKTRKYKFMLFCYDGGWGWGETGQKGKMIVKAKNKKEAEKICKSYIPGGWTIKYKGITKEETGLTTNLL